MCLNQDDACAATRFYLHQCRQQGVHLSPPKECGKYPNFYYRSNTHHIMQILNCFLILFVFPIIVQCVAPNDESFEAGETIRISPKTDDYNPVSSADTVFLVEEKPCNQEPTKHLGSLVYEIEQELTKAGMFYL